MFTVSLNKQVFVLYTGLWASGYDLTRLEDTDPLSQVVEAIKATDWDSGALDYFSQALRAFVENWHVRGARQMECFIEDCLKACAE